MLALGTNEETVGFLCRNFSDYEIQEVWWINEKLHFVMKDGDSYTSIHEFAVRKLIKVGDSAMEVSLLYLQIKLMQGDVTNFWWKYGEITELI